MFPEIFLEICFQAGNSFPGNFLGKFSQVGFLCTAKDFLGNIPEYFPGKVKTFGQ